MLPATLKEIKDRHAKAGIVDLTALLGSQELAKHKAVLTAELEKASAKIDRFGWDSMDERLQDALLVDWMDTLAPYALEEVRAAINVLLGGKNPKHAMNEQQVKAEILRARKERLAAIPKDRPADEPRAHIDAETRANILTERGFGHVVKRFPKVGDAQ